jgi:hypothetical protein
VRMAQKGEHAMKDGESDAVRAPHPPTVLHATATAGMGNLPFRDGRCLSWG